jgi:DNA modification methylase
MECVYRSHVNTIWKGDALEVAAAEEPGSFSLAILDGPYGMRKASWDMMKVADLPEWYAPFLDDVGRLCAPSASLYVWNTAEGWATLHAGIVARGWVFAGLVIWNKRGGHPARLTAARASKWPDVTEVCGHYQRGDAHHANTYSGNVWSTDTANEMRKGERLYNGSTVRRTGGGGRYYECREPLHPCQKPLKFAERIIRASSLPGQRVWVPFGGTCREAVAAEWMARADPEEARRVVTAELDQDGRSYLDAVVAQLEGRDVRRPNDTQVGLFA